MTLQSELQRLSGTKLDAQGAANVWAGTTGLDLVGALNAKAGTTGLPLNAAVRALAGAAREADSGLAGYSGVAVPTFTPTEITGLQVWLKADALAGTDSLPVASWTDSSGLSRHATQATVLNQPTFLASAVNGKPALRFDDTNDTMTIPAFTLAQPLTVFVTFRIPFVGSWSLLAGGLHIYNDTLAAATTWAGNTFWTWGSAITQSAWYTFAVRFNGASSKANRSDSATTFTSHPGTNGWEAGLYIGGSTNSARFGSDMAEVIVYNSALSGADVDRVGGYLATKYGVTWTGGAT